MADPASGDVWYYDYLWRRQHEAGETEGRKTRPVVFVATIRGKDGRANLFILPITSSPPGHDRLAIEIPEIERRRAGLDDIPSWVIIDEYNHDVLGRSYYFDPNARIGGLSAAFHRLVIRTFADAARARAARRVPRADTPDR